MINLNKAVGLNWVSLGPVSKWRLSNASADALEYIVIESGTPSFQAGHRLEGFQSVAEESTGILFAKVARGKLPPGSIMTVLTRDKMDVAFGGVVADYVFEVDVAITPITLTFSGDNTPFTYTVQAGTLPTGLTLTSNVISGTPTAVATQAGIVIRATDSASKTADTNAFEIDITAGE